MSNDLISVIIPVYNSAPYLERCLNSITQNTYQSLEIICVNDGSTDDSLEVLNRLAQKDSRIRIIDQLNHGVSAARNRGLDTAQGKYVTFIDSDDWIHRDFFSLLYIAAHNNQADLVVGGYLQVCEYDDAKRIQSFPSREDTYVSSYELCISGNLTSSPWAKLFRRDAVADLRFPEDIRFGEDQIFNIQFFSSSETLHVRYLNLPIYFYFDRPNSLVHNSDSQRFYLIAQHYLTHIEDYVRKDILLSHIYRTLYAYRHEGFIVSDKKVISRNTSNLFREAHPWLLREKRFSAKEKLKYLVAAASPSLYRAQLLAKDPTMRTYEKVLRERAHSHSNK